jgi:hypothetical protein
MITLMDINGKYHVYEGLDLIQQLIELDFTLYGMSLPVIRELRHEALKRGAKLPLSVSGVQEVFGGTEAREDT